MKRMRLKGLNPVSFLIIGLLASSLIAYASTPTSTLYLTGGVYPGAPTFTIWKEGGTYYAKDAYGYLQYSGTNASYVINSAIYSAQYGIGGPILLEPAYYVLTQKIFFDTSIKGSGTKSVALMGRAWSGLPVYPIDIDQIPFACTLIEPDSSYHGNLIQIGQSTDSDYKDASVSIENLVLIGFPSSTDNDDRQGQSKITMTHGDSAIMAWNPEQCIFKNLAIMFSYYGIYVTTGSSSTAGPLILENIFFGYNVHHLRLDGQTYGVMANNIWGYLSYQSGFIISCVDGKFQNIRSNADNYENTTFPQSTFYIFSKGSVTFRDIVIQNSKDATYGGIRGMLIETAADGAQLFLDNILIQGVNGDAIRTGGLHVNGTITLSHLYASPYPTAMWGGEGRNHDYGIRHYANNTDIFIQNSDLRNNGYGAWLGTTANATFTNVRGYP